MTKQIVMGKHRRAWMRSKWKKWKIEERQDEDDNVDVDVDVRYAGLIGMIDVGRWDIINKINNENDMCKQVNKIGKWKL